MIYTVEKDKVTFRVDRNKTNYAQRNNKFIWEHPKNPKLRMDALAMCNVTSYVMAADYLGFKFPNGKYDQPEDNFADFIFKSKEIDEFYSTKMPVLYEAYKRGDTDAYCPNLIHIVLAYSFNLWIGTTAATFNERLPITDIVKEVTEFNRPVVLSGTFPYKYKAGNIGTIGHINTLVGIEFADFDKKLNLDKATFIVDDPYGDWKQNFLSGTGNDTRFKLDEFIKYYKNLNDRTTKFAHTFKNSVAAI